MEDRALSDNPMVREAYERGRKARLAGTSRDECPFGSYPGRAFRRAWYDGWDAAVPPPAPVVVTRPVAVVLPGSFLPAGASPPAYYTRPAPIPCARCRCVRLADQGQAVLLSSTWRDAAYLVCQNCGHRFKLPIREGDR